MKSKNMLSKRIKYGLIVLLIMLTTIKVPVFAVEDEPTQSENSAYIEMKVKTAKVGDTKQVLVECWASNLTKLEGIDVAFSYDKEILQPSNINGNKILDNLNDIKTWPISANPTTGLSDDEIDAFNEKNLSVLSNSFAFDSKYQDKLDLDVFRYLNTDDETLQFVMSKKVDTETIDISEEELIGTFSFVQADTAKVEDGAFTRIKTMVICNDGDDDVVIVPDTLEFTYQKYGSISGVIDIKMENGTKYFPTKNIATIKVYKKQDVESINWLSTGKNYISMKENLPDPIAEHTTTEKENGTFIIDNIEFDEYVVLIDKEYFADFIITNVIVSAENKDIRLSDTEELKSINLIPGDLNKDGKINGTDTTAYKKDLNGSEKLVDFDDASTKGVKNTGTDTRIFNKYLNLYGKVAKTQTIKKVYNLLGGEYEE